MKKGGEKMTEMTKKDASRIQSSSDKKGKSNGFKERATRAAAKRQDKS